VFPFKSLHQREVNSTKGLNSNKKLARVSSYIKGIGAYHLGLSKRHTVSEARPVYRGGLNAGLNSSRDNGFT
jgi:hypothetical protein